MRVGYTEVRKGAVEIAAAIADARSARNQRSRRERDAQQEEIEACRARGRRRRKEKEELDQALRRRVRITLMEKERPRVGRTTARKLFQRTKLFSTGSIGTSDFRGPDGRHSIHFDFTPRGFASWKGRRWRVGEAERAARYITREEGLEAGEEGWWSNIADDRTELVGFFRTLEAFERHDRKNANVYISEIVALPAELTPKQRRHAVRRICGFFERRGLGYVAALHLPDKAGDARNFHCHILYSLRPCDKLDAYDWEFATSKVNDINTPDGIRARRKQVVRAVNATLIEAGINKRLTYLSNRARRMAAPEPTHTQAERAITRRLEALEKRQEMLRKIKMFASRAKGGLMNVSTRLSSERGRLVGRLVQLRLVASNLAPPAALENARQSMVAALRGKRDIVDVTCAVRYINAEIHGSVAAKRLRACTKQVIHRRMQVANAASNAAYEIRGFLTERRTKVGGKTTTAVAAVQSAEVDTTRALERLRLDAMRRLERSQARLKKAKGRAEAMRPLLIARRAFEVADEQYQDAVSRLGGFRATVTHRLRLEYERRFEPQIERLQFVRRLAQDRCDELKADIIASCEAAAHNIRRLEPATPAPERAKLSSAARLPAESEQTSTNANSLSSAQPEAAPAIGRERASGLVPTKSPELEQLRDYARNRTPDPALIAHVSREPPSKSPQAGLEACDQNHSAKEAARAAVKQREDQVWPRLLKSALRRLHTLEIPILRTETGRYVFAKDTIPAEELAVFMDPKMEEARQVVLARIAELQEQRRRQALIPYPISQPERKAAPDDAWHKTMQQYRKWKGDHEIG